MNEYALVERPILDWLCGDDLAPYGSQTLRPGLSRGLGWTYRSDDAMAAYGRPLEDPLVESLLVEKLKAINPEVRTDAQAMMAVSALRRAMMHPDRLTANRQTLDLLSDGARVPLNPGEDAKTVQFIAFDPDRQHLNDFTATNQYCIQGVRQCRE
ncbi:MAG: hypothetical protein GX595_20870, partial [Lentisphaerae bacterium]|nr:hypothetical protein [Lentisphaerota bacterium]